MLPPWLLATIVAAVNLRAHPIHPLEMTSAFHLVFYFPRLWLRLIVLWYRSFISCSESIELTECERTLLLFSELWKLSTVVQVFSSLSPSLLQGLTGCAVLLGLYIPPKLLPALLSVLFTWCNLLK